MMQWALLFKGTPVFQNGNFANNQTALGGYNYAKDLFRNLILSRH